MADQNKSFFVIYGWMAPKLNLNGVKLSVFAIVYGFVSKGHPCRVSYDYMARITGSTDRGIRKAVDQLIELEYIVKIQENGKVNRYTIPERFMSPTPELSSTPTPELSSPPPRNSVPPTPELSSYDSIYTETVTRNFSTRKNVRGNNVCSSADAETAYTGDPTTTLEEWRGGFSNFVKTYAEFYRNRIGMPHPRVKNTQLMSCIDSLAETEADFQSWSKEDMFDLFDAYFRFCKNTDHNINHLCTPGVLRNALYNSGKW